MSDIHLLIFNLPTSNLPEKQVAADRAKARFNQEEGDHLALIKVYEEYEENNCSEAWCYDSYINAKTMSIAQVRRADWGYLENHYFSG